MITSPRLASRVLSGIRHQPAARALLQDAAIAVLAVVAAVVVLAGIGQPVRALAGLALVGLAPGGALVRRLRLTDPLTRAVLAVCVSLSATTMISLALMYLHQWSWQRCVVALAALTVLLAVPWRWPPAPDRSRADAERVGAEPAAPDRAGAGRADAERGGT